MKKLRKGLIASLFVYLLMYNGQWTGYQYHSLGQCQAARPSPVHYCIWN